MNTKPPLLVVSASREETARLLENGPRRDFVELAAATRGEVLYRSGRAAGGWRGRLAGPHVRQAWAAARMAGRGQAVFADGEHVGIPLACFLILCHGRAGRVVMLGHLVSKPWKLALLAVVSRLGGRGLLVLHSREQERRARRWLGRRWRTKLVPYQVDTAYWRLPVAASAQSDGVPLVLAVGSENRDYATLTAAVTGLPVRCVIAAGSHWARTTAGTEGKPANVEYIREPLPFAQLRELYGGAALVVVPLHDVINQSGITTILEAMSMGLPVIVSAAPGQQEAICGPLVLGAGECDAGGAAGRGPQAFGDASPEQATGLYVPVADVSALRAAIERLLGDPACAARIGAAARASAVRSFPLERFVGTLASMLGETPAAAREEAA